MDLGKPRLLRGPYEVISYLLPGFLAIILVGAYFFDLRSTGVLIERMGSVALVAFGVASLPAAYAAGRLLYSLGDISTKPLTLYLFGNPDRYLFRDGEITRRDDYSRSFKNLVRTQFSQVFAVDSNDSDDLPYFSMMICWMEANLQTSIKVLERVDHDHAVEIFCRNIATLSLVLMLVSLYWMKVPFFLLWTASFWLFLVYTGRRQRARARSVIEGFFVVSRIGRMESKQAGLGILHEDAESRLA